MAECEDCGGPGVSWEVGAILCDDCARLRAKRWQMKREGDRGDELIYHGGPLDRQPLNLHVLTANPHDDEYEVRTDDGRILGAWWTGGGELSIRPIRPCPNCGDTSYSLDPSDGVLYCDGCNVELGAPFDDTDREA